MAGEHGTRDSSPTRLPKALRTPSEQLPFPLVTSFPAQVHQLVSCACSVPSRSSEAARPSIFTQGAAAWNVIRHTPSPEAERRPPKRVLSRTVHSLVLTAFVPQGGERGCEESLARTGNPEARLRGEWGKLSTREGGSRRAGDGEGAISPRPQVLSPGEEEGGKPGVPCSPADPLHAWMGKSMRGVEGIAELQQEDWMFCSKGGCIQAKCRGGAGEPLSLTPWREDPRGPPGANQSE